MIRTLLIVFATLYMSGTILADDEGPLFYVKATVKAEGAKGASGGSGGFSLPESEYGRIVFAFYENGTSQHTMATGGKVTPAHHLSEKYYPQANSDGLTMTVDLYLKSRITEDGQIRLSGLMTQMTRAQDQDEPLFTYSEEKIKILLSNGGSEELTIKSVPPWENIRVWLYVSCDDQLVFEPKSTTEITFKGEYSLYNEATKRIESKEGCGNLTFNARDTNGSHGACYHKKTFALPSGDSLMLMTSHGISKVRQNDDGSVTYDLEVTRYYAVNPYQADSIVHGGSFINLGEHGLAADRMTVTRFNRTITAQPGETTEIAIPSDEGNLLGFPFTERLKLVAKVETKSY